MENNKKVKKKINQYHHTNEHNNLNFKDHL